MPAPGDPVEQLGAALSRARRENAVADLPLADLPDLRQAEAVQLQAVQAYGDLQIGYGLQGTSVLMQRKLGCRSPIFGPLFDKDVRPYGNRIHLPRGALGAGCSLVFTIGRPYPADGEDAIGPTASDAVVECRPMIQVLGRRVPGRVPLNALTATADFALDALSVTGDRITDLRMPGLASLKVSARINGHVVATGGGADILGHPLEAVAWLGQALASRGQRLNAGDLVAIGTCVGVLQVVPGQVFQADFAGLAELAVNFA